MSDHMDGVTRIGAERTRQIEAGYTAEHDAQHSGIRWEGALARAGAAYAVSSYGSHLADDLWPFSDQWKPSGSSTVERRIRDLEKAGALIAAEIDRLLAIDGATS